VGVDAQSFLVSSTSIEHCFFGVCLGSCMVLIGSASALFCVRLRQRLGLALPRTGCRLVSVSD